MTSNLSTRAPRPVSPSPRTAVMPTPTASTGRRLAALAAVATAAVMVVGAPAPATAAPSCTTPPATDGVEPPCNPHLADSPWPGNHRNAYAQASSPFPGPAGPADHVNVDHDSLVAAPIVLSFSPTYPDGGRVIWASTVGATAEVVKIDPATVTVIDKYIPQVEEGAGPGTVSVSGAYNVVDADNHLLVGQATGLEVYGDAVPGERRSTIALLRRFDLPAEARCGDDDTLVGITMTWDGRVAFATANGVVGTVPRDPAKMDAAHLRTLSLNGPDCAGGPDGAVETVSNSIAADEDGGIYVVTSHAMVRVDDGPDGLAVTWRAGYAGAGGSGGGRLGAGSGATPSLMGTGDDDRFVVITDGQELMHLVLMWRDEVPADWEPIRPGADPRIACEVPVTFGDPDAQRSLSEQSVLVRGTSAVVVNNLMQLDPVLGQLPPRAAPLSQLLSGLPGNEPRGIQRFAWDPATRTCSEVWANPDVAIPNGIPTMSAASGLLYGIGARDGVWTLEGLDWDTGEVVLTVPTTAFPMSNSFYAATTVGPDETVWTGTFGGVTRFQACAPGDEGGCGRRLDPAEAVVGQLPTDPEAAARDTIGLPNDDPAPADDPSPDDAGTAPGEVAGGEAEEGGAGGAPLPSTGGGAGLAALLAAIAGATGRATSGPSARGRRRRRGEDLG